MTASELNTSPWSQSLRLVSLWEILNTNLISLGEELIGHLTYLTSIELLLDQMKDTDTNEDTRKRILVAAIALEKITGQLDLKTSRWSACSLVDASVLTRASDLYRFVHNTTLTLTRELHTIKFLHATADMEQYLDVSFPYGKPVAETFTDCSEDICEAHQCFGFGQYTAAMFHLGRAMELVVKRLAKKMGAIPRKKDDWQSYLNAMNEKIDAIPFHTPALRKKRQPYTQATAYLLHFKEAWRHETMHPKKTYTRTEAYDVIGGAGAFLRFLSVSLFKPRKSS